MASANAIGVIPNERRLNRSRHFSGEIDQVEGASSGCNKAAMLVGNLSEAAMQNGRNPLPKVPLRSFAYDCDCSFLERQFESTARLIYIGHALLLPGGRVWRPLIRRARDAERACERRADGRNCSHGYSVDLVRPSPPLRSRNVLGISDSGYFRGHNNVPNRSASRAIFGLINIRTVGCLGVRSIDGLQASRRNLDDHGQDSPNPIDGKLLSAINSRLSQQIQFGETNYVHI